MRSKTLHRDSQRKDVIYFSKILPVCLSSHHQNQIHFPVHFEQYLLFTITIIENGTKNYMENQMHENITRYFTSNKVLRF